MPGHALFAAIKRGKLNDFLIVTAIVNLFIYEKKKMILVLQILRYKKNYFCRPEMFCKKVFLKIFQNSQENTWKKGSGTSAFLWI